MSEEITEALFEMHYHRAIVDAFASVFGARFLRILKPSTQQEAWVGFDQGWVRTSLSASDFYNELSGTVRAGGASVDAFHLGYFLQFKVVRTVTRRSHLSPTGFMAPYLRSELSVNPNPRTGLSQHETLCRLAKIEGALVYYACPLLFDIDKIYEEPDLDSLQVVDVATAPVSIVAASGRHFLAFQDLANVAPIWCSEPHPGRGYRAPEWVREEDVRPRRRSGLELMELMSSARATLSENLEPHARIDGQSVRLPQSFTVLSFSM